MFFVSSKENVFSNMDTLYLRENENQGHMKKKRFFWDTSYISLVEIEGEGVPIIFPHDK